MNGQLWHYKGTKLTGTKDNGDNLEFDYDFENNKSVLKFNGKEIANEEKLKINEGVEYKLDRDYYFVMGDHRNNSNDSRSIGPLELDMIIGTVTMINGVEVVEK